MTTRTNFNDRRSPTSRSLLRFSSSTAWLVAAAAIALSPLTAHAHRDDGLSALSALSALPVASVVVAGSAAAGASAAAVTLPVALSAGGAVLVVKSIEITARGTLCVLERASDGARVSLEFAGRSFERTVLSVGKSVQLSVLSSGTVLSVLGEAIAFVPNELGRALLHNEQLTY